MFCTLQYTSICLIQLSNFSTFSSPSYIGKSNLTSSLIKDAFLLCTGLLGGVRKLSSFPFPLEWSWKWDSSSYLSRLEPNESSTLRFLKSLYISLTIDFIARKLSMNWGYYPTEPSSDIVFRGKTLPISGLVSTNSPSPNLSFDLVSIHN